MGWAVLGGALALLTHRKGLAVLVGTVVAVIGTAVKITAVLVLTAGILGGAGGGAGLVTVGRAMFVGIFAACGLLLVALLRTLHPVRAWRGREVSPRPGRLRRAWWHVYGQVQRGREYADEVATDEIYRAKVRARVRAGGRVLLSLRDRFAPQAASRTPPHVPGPVAGIVGTAATPGARTRAALRPAGGGAAAPSGVLGGPGRRSGGGVDAELAAFEERAKAFRAEMEQVHGRR